jgi:uncharacterized protein YjiS (DUF1127 family)
MSTSNIEVSTKQSPSLQACLRFGTAFVGCIAAPWLAITEFRRVRRMENELSGLDDRMLRDIGLTRSEIPHLARFGRNAR